MKKISGIILLLCLLTAATFAQDKKNRFGLRGDGSLNWMKPENEKRFTNDGPIIRGGFGLQIELGLGSGDNAAIVTGFGLNSDGGKLEFRASDSTTYYTVEEEFVEPSSSTGADVYKLVKRRYRNQYLNIPFLLKMKTNEIGAMTYFAQTGLVAGFNYRADVDDEVIDALDKTITVENLDNERDIQFLNMGLLIGGGAELNLSGSTSLLMGVNVNLGFLNVLRKNSRYLESNGEAVEQQSNSRNVGLSIGILF